MFKTKLYYSYRPDADYSVGYGTFFISRKAKKLFAHLPCVKVGEKAIIAHPKTFKEMSAVCDILNTNKIKEC